MENSIKNINLADWGIHPADLDPWQLKRLGLEQVELVDDYGWPHLSRSTLLALITDSHENDDMFKQVKSSLIKHLDECEVCSSRYFFANRLLNEPPTFKEDEPRYLIMSKENPVPWKITHDNATAKIKIQDNLFGISCGIWSLDLNYKMSKKVLAASLVPPDSAQKAKCWTSFQLGMADWSYQKDSHCLLEFTPDQLAVEISQPFSFGRVWEYGVFLKGVPPKWYENIFLPYYQLSWDLGQPFKEKKLIKDFNLEGDSLSLNGLNHYLNWFLKDPFGRPVFFEPSLPISLENISGDLLTPWGEIQGEMHGYIIDNILQLTIKSSKQDNFFVFEDEEDQGYDGELADVFLILG